MLKKLCSIDSVQFEKNLGLCKKGIIKVKNYGHSQIHVSKRKIQKYINENVNTGKKYIRKKLHPETTQQTASSFITTMKED